jgi:hypothetical protein
MVCNHQTFGGPRTGRGSLPPTPIWPGRMSEEPRHWSTRSSWLSGGGPSRLTGLCGTRRLVTRPTAVTMTARSSEPGSDCPISAVGPAGRQKPQSAGYTGDPWPASPRRRHAGGDLRVSNRGAQIARLTLRVSVLHLSRVEFHRSARRHEVPDDDVEHAVAHPIGWVELGDDPPRYLLVGPDRAGNLLEVVVMVVDGTDLVIHAMRLRHSTEREIFGDDQ